MLAAEESDVSVNSDQGKKRLGSFLAPSFLFVFVSTRLQYLLHKLDTHMLGFLAEHSAFFWGPYGPHSSWEWYGPDSPLQQHGIRHLSQLIIQLRKVQFGVNAPLHMRGVVDIPHKNDVLMTELQTQAINTSIRLCYLVYSIS